MPLNGLRVGVAANPAALAKESMPVPGSPIPPSTQIIYQTSWGELSFWFNETGRLGRIDMRVNQSF